MKYGSTSFVANARGLIALPLGAWSGALVLPQHTHSAGPKDYFFRGADVGGLRPFLNMNATWIATTAAVVGMLQGMMILGACSLSVTHRSLSQIKSDHTTSV